MAQNNTNIEQAKALKKQRKWWEKYVFFNISKNHLLGPKIYYMVVQKWYKLKRSDFFVKRKVLG